MRVYSVEKGWRVRPQTESGRVGTYNRAEGLSTSLHPRRAQNI